MTAQEVINALELLPDKTVDVYAFQGCYGVLAVIDECTLVKGKDIDGYPLCIRDYQRDKHNKNGSVVIV